ncbi:MAG: hypothetical protein B7C24_14675 [Bacteroidetes bacterium 4572_77]|nr:MAG: hypothetical protein B7C24_14675 [Bacteroidetes bacterium 4572_77]
MKKLLLSLAIASMVWVSCDNAPKEVAETEAVVEVVEPTLLDINKFDEMADALAGKLIVIEGTCMHTCEHGGTKMFISGDDADFRVKVMATDESGNFNMEMEGTDYAVVGTLVEYRVDNAELDKLEAEVLSGEVSEEDMKHKTHDGEQKEGAGHADHKGDGGDHDADKQGQLEQIQSLRDRLLETGKDHLSYWHVDAVSYKELKKKEVK